MNKNISVFIIAQEPRQSQTRQLELFPSSKQQKPQIASIPGVSPRERNRYRVVLGNGILGDRLSIDEAINLAKRGGQ
jgi:hypothetical protein